MTRFLLVLNDQPYGTERSYNGLRLALNLMKKDPATVMRVFLVGDAAWCAKRGQTLPSGYYSIETMLKGLAQRGASVGVCGTCMDARGIKEEELAEGTKRSSLDQWTEWTVWAEKTLVF
ncbi:MAG TPA: DsrE family protein [Thermoplasmata archaeon]|nr:DsrE family protein [Thermoplasmata archaeon]